MLKCYRALEIYTSGQVDTLNKTLKLSYTSKGRRVNSAWPPCMGWCSDYWECNFYIHVFSSE